jgi:hypothetical protein
MEHRWSSELHQAKPNYLAPHYGAIFILCRPSIVTLYKDYTESKSAQTEHSATTLNITITGRWLGGFGNQAL